MWVTAKAADPSAAAALVLSPGKASLLPLVFAWPCAKPFQHNKVAENFLFFLFKQCVGVYTRVELHVKVHTERLLHSGATEAAEFGVRRAMKLAQRRMWLQEPEVRSCYAALEKQLMLG